MKRPRFIAGAVCPKCGAMDRLQLLDLDGDTGRRCVACGHEDRLESASSMEPKTRLGADQRLPASESDQVAPVRILDPGAASAADD